MKQLRRPDKDENPTYITIDIEILRNTAVNMGFLVSRIDLQEAYAEWSEDYYCAGWLMLPSTQEGIKEIIQELIVLEYLV